MLFVFLSLLFVPRVTGYALYTLSSPITTISHGTSFSHSFRPGPSQHCHTFQSSVNHLATRRLAIANENADADAEFVKAQLRKKEEAYEKQRAAQIQSQLKASGDADLSSFPDLPSVSRIDVISPETGAIGESSLHLPLTHIALQAA